MSLTKRWLDAQTESLAGLLAAVLQHPETPARLYNAIVDKLADLSWPNLALKSLSGFYNAIVDELADLSAGIDYRTPEMIALALQTGRALRAPRLQCKRNVSVASA